jgi:hypothetical protein
MGIRLVVWSTSAALLFLPAGGRAQPLPAGGEVRVNTTTAGSQTAPAAAFDSSGNFVTVWQSGGSGLAGTLDTDVFLQRWNADGTLRGSELRVNTTTLGCQGAPAVAGAPNGAFVVVWQSQGQDGDGWGIFAQRYDPSGATVGGEIAVNQATAGDQQAPTVAYDPLGSFFTVAWESQGTGTTGWDVLARQFDAGTGAPLAGEVRLNATLAGDQRHPALALLPGGGLATAWEGPDTDGTGIYLREWTSALTPTSGEVAANTISAGLQAHPALGCDDSGNCILAWESSGQDSSAAGIYARRFDRTASPLTAAEFRVNTTTSGLVAAPAVVSFPSGDFFVSWESDGQDAGSAGVYAQAYDFRSLAIGSEQRVNTYLPGAQRGARLAAGTTGALLALWESTGQDGDGAEAAGVYAQRYTLPGWRFYSLSPCRLYDSRTTTPLVSGVPRTLPVAGSCAIPATARAVSANLTVVTPTNTGFVLLFPADAAAPLVSLINFSTGQTRSNNALVTLARTGAGNFTASAAVSGTGNVQLIIDLNGYFQ